MVFPGVATRLRGGVGVVAGVPGTTEDGFPAPAAFTALTAKRYVVPLDRPVTTMGDVLDAGVTGVRRPPPLIEYW